MNEDLKWGKKAAATNKEKYGEDFYRRIGKMGGKSTKFGPFLRDRKLASEAGKKGGRASARKRWGDPDEIAVAA